eukprot:1173430-Prorocentrum_minimum.AAC.1
MQESTRDATPQSPLAPAAPAPWDPKGGARLKKGSRTNRNSLVMGEPGGKTHRNSLVTGER